MARLDLVIKGRTVATATDTFDRDVGIRDRRIVAHGEDLGPAGEVLDARGRLVPPAGQRGSSS